MATLTIHYRTYVSYFFTFEIRSYNGNLRCQHSKNFKNTCISIYNEYKKDHTVAFVRKKLNFRVLFTHFLFKYKMRPELIGIHN